MIDLEKILVIAVASLVLANFAAALLLTVDWRRTYYGLRAWYRGWTRDDWRFLELCKVVAMVALWLRML